MSFAQTMGYIALFTNHTRRRKCLNSKWAERRSLGFVDNRCCNIDSMKQHFLTARSLSYTWRYSAKKGAKTQNEVARVAQYAEDENHVFSLNSYVTETQNTNKRI